MRPGRKPREFSQQAQELFDTTKPPRCRCPYCANRDFYDPGLHDTWKMLSLKEQEAFRYEMFIRFESPKHPEKRFVLQEHQI